MHRHRWDIPSQLVPIETQIHPYLYVSEPLLMLPWTYRQSILTKPHIRHIFSNTIDHRIATTRGWQARYTNKYNIHDTLTSKRQHRATSLKNKSKKFLNIFYSRQFASSSSSASIESNIPNPDHLPVIHPLYANKHGCWFHHDHFIRGPRQPSPLDRYIQKQYKTGGKGNNNDLQDNHFITINGKHFATPPPYNLSSSIPLSLHDPKHTCLIHNVHFNKHFGMSTRGSCYPLASLPRLPPSVYSSSSAPSSSSSSSSSSSQYMSQFQQRAQHTSTRNHNNIWGNNDDSGSLHTVRSYSSSSSSSYPGMMIQDEFTQGWACFGMRKVDVYKEPRDPRQYIPFAMIGAWCFLVLSMMAMDKLSKKGGASGGPGSNGGRRGYNNNNNNTYDIDYNDPIYNKSSALPITDDEIKAYTRRQIYNARKDHEEYLEQHKHLKELQNDMNNHDDPFHRQFNHGDGLFDDDSNKIQEKPLFSIKF